MILLKNVTNKNIGVFGLARTGLATINSLVKSGANVFSYDDNQDLLIKAKEAGANTEHYKTWSKNMSFIVMSPGVPLTNPKPHPIVDFAKENHIPLVSDIELFINEQKNSKFIGVTGTNGKTTTVSLIYHVLKEAGYSVEIAGNIGKPVLALDNIDDCIYVLELSSYQLDLMNDVKIDYGILLNISPDHLERHATMENYSNIKSKILKMANVSYVFIDDEYSKKHSIELKKIGKNINELSVNDNHMLDFNKFKKMPGLHNIQNIMAAYSICKEIMLKKYNEEYTNKIIEDSILTFNPIPHRQQYIKTINNIDFVNDSKATNCSSTNVALLAWKNIYLIVGGVFKEIEPIFDKKGLNNIKEVFIIGSSSQIWQEYFNKQGIKNHIYESLELATLNAYMVANDNGSGTVLLSPACASFDMFKNYENRGEIFIDIVNSIK